jgi:hypothetical protein
MSTFFLTMCSDYDVCVCLCVCTCALVLLIRRARTCLRALCVDVWGRVRGLKVALATVAVSMSRQLCISIVVVLLPFNSVFLPLLLMTILLLFLVLSLVVQPWRQTADNVLVRAVVSTWFMCICGNVYVRASACACMRSCAFCLRAFICESFLWVILCMFV